MKRDIAPILFLLGVILIAFGLPVLLGYSLLADYVTPSVFPSGFFHKLVRFPAGSTLVVDPVASLQTLPWNKMAGDALKQGSIPLWNPYSLTGMPFMANIQSAFLFPVQTLQDMMPSYVWSLIYILRFCIAGIFTFLFLRRIGFEGLAAASGGIIFALSGSIIFYFRLEPAFNSYIMLPVVLYFFERLSSQWSGKNLLFASLSFGLLAISGQPEISVLNALFAGCYSFFRGWQKHAAGCKTPEAFRPLVLYPIGILMALPLLLPVTEYFLWSADKGRTEIGQIHLSPRVMILQVIPYLLGHVQHPINTQAGGIFYWNLAGGYIGVIVTYLAIMGILSKHGKTHNGIVKFMMFSTSILIMKIYGMPLFQWLGTLPVLKQFLFTRYSGAALTMSVATLAAMGNQEILTNRNPGVKRRAFFVTLVLLGILLVPVTGVITAKLDTYGKRMVLGSLAVTSTLLILLWRLAVRKNTGREAFIVTALLAAELIILVPYGLTGGMELLRVASIFMLCLCIVPISTGRRLTAGALILLSITVMSTSLIISENGPPKNRDLFHGSPFITFLKEKQSLNYGRAFFLDGFLSGNLSTAFGIYGLNVCEAFVPGNMNKFSRRCLDPHANPVYFDGDNGFRNGGSAREALFQNKKYYDFIGLRYIVASPGRGISEGLERKIPEHKQNVAVGFAPGDMFILKLRMESDELSGIRVLMATYKRKNNGEIVLTIKDGTGKVQAISERDAISLVDNEYNEFRFGPIKLKKGTDLVLEWKYIKGTPGAAVAFWCEPDMKTGYELQGSSQFSGVLPYIVQQFDGGFIKVYDREARIWENTSAFPRAFVVHDVKAAGSTKEALDMMETLDLKDQAVITTKENALAFNSSNSGLRSIAKVKAMDARRIVISLEGVHKGLLVIPDTYYSGWTAKVDGATRPIFETDGAFRGIFLDSGDKEVVIEYKSKPFLYGTGIALLSAVCCVIPWNRLRGRV